MLRSIIKRVGRAISQFWSGFKFALTRGKVILRNRIRRARRLSADFVVIPISGSLPERSTPPRGFWTKRLPLPTPELSLQTLNHIFTRVAEAENIQGVLLILREIAPGIARLQNLRVAIDRLRQSGKICIVYTPYLDLAHYYVASAADRIIVPPSAMFEVVGIQSEALFLKDALTHLGVQIEVVQSAPYKSAFNAFDKAKITSEQAEQINWLLDEHFDIITSEIAHGRGLGQPDVLGAIDDAPMSAEQAIAKGLIDDIAYEDDLYRLLANSDGEKVTRDEPISDSGENAADGAQERPKANLVTWSEAHRLLMEVPKKRSKRYIGVYTLEGTIMMGESRQPPFRLPIPVFGDRTIGEESAVTTLRRLKDDPDLAALIIHVDSGGGSALASDLIWREIEQIARERPVLTYMGNVAASGGYYIGAAAEHIIAQSLTITGSIGVITMHVSTADLYDKLDINRVTFRRGKKVGLRSDAAPLDEAEKQALQDSIDVSYRQFKERVSDSRKLPFESLDSICDGRVWTGRQALANHLIDDIGDFETAIQKAAEMAEISLTADQELSVYNIYGRGGGYELPDPANISNSIAILKLRDLILSESGKPWMIMPFKLTIR